MEKDVSPPLLSHMHGNDSLFHKALTDSANLQNHFVIHRRPCYFPFREVATVTVVQFTVYSCATEDRRHETRQTRERGSRLKSFRRAFTTPQISNDHRHSYLSVLYRGCFPRSILSPPLPSVLFIVVIFRRLIAKIG